MSSTKRSEAAALYFPKRKLSTQSKTRAFVLREFGLLMALVSALFTAVLMYKGNSWSLLSTLLICLFSLAALFFPFSLDLVERLWMGFAERLSVIMSKLVVVLTFYLAITPFAFVLRILRKDLLEIRLEERQSYFHSILPLEGTEAEKAVRHRQPF